MGQIESKNESIGTDKESLNSAVAIFSGGPFGGGKLDEPIVGHVSGFEGSKLDECHSIILVKTPHGSIVRIGRSMVRKAITEDLKRLHALEIVAEGRSLGEYPGLDPKEIRKKQ